MISHRPGFAPQEVPSTEIHPRYLYGFKGWLFVVTGFFTFLGISAIYSSCPNRMEEALFTEASPETLTAISLLGAILHLWVAGSLYFKRDGSLTKAKIGLVLAGAVSYLDYYVSEGVLVDFTDPVEYLIILSVVVLYATPFLYLTFSRRVRNTYMYFNRLLPKSFKCPFCLNEIRPKEQERTRKEAVCLHCSKLVSRFSVAA